MEPSLQTMNEPMSTHAKSGPHMPTIKSFDFHNNRRYVGLPLTKLTTKVQWLLIVVIAYKCSNNLLSFTGSLVEVGLR
jgi:hypothetical protein